MKFDRIVPVAISVLLAAGAARAARLQSATGIDTTDLATGGTVTGSVCAAAYPVTSLFDDDVSNSAGRWLATYSAGNMYAV